MADPTGCRDGFATDRFLFVNNGNECSINLTTYWIIAGVSIFVRIIIFFLQIRLMIHIYHLRVSDRNGRRRRRIALVGILELFTCISTIIAFILWGFNMINSSNGLGSFIFALIFFPAHAILFLSVLKMVHLGIRIANVGGVKKGENVNIVEAEKLSSIQNDYVLRYIFVFMVLLFLMVLGFVGIIAPITQSYFRTDLYLKIGLSCDVFYIACTQLMIVRQTYRVYNAVSIKSKSTSVNTAASNHPPSGAKTDPKLQGLNRIMRRLRIRAQVWTLVLLYLVAVLAYGGIYPKGHFTYEIIISIIWVNIISSGIAVWMNMPTNTNLSHSQPPLKPVLSAAIKSQSDEQHHSSTVGGGVTLPSFPSLSLSSKLIRKYNPPKNVAMLTTVAEMSEFRLAQTTVIESEINMKP